MEAENQILNSTRWIETRTGGFDLAGLLGAGGNRPALVCGDERLTYADVQQQLLKMVTRLQALGISPGQRVGLYAPDSWAHLLMLLAAWVMDFCFVPLNPKAPLDELLGYAPLKVLFTSVPPYRRPDDLRVHDLTALATSVAVSSQAVLPERLPLQQETALVFTSGSSDTPKGVVHSLGNYLYSAAGSVSYLAMTPADRWLVSLPLFHVGGLLIFVRTLLAGATTILPAAGQTTEQALVHQGPSLLSLVPTQLLRWMDAPASLAALSTCRAILLGGAPAPGGLIERARHQKLPILPTYGATESCAQLTGVPPGANAETYYTAGRPLAFRQLKLDADGVIHIAGKVLFQYYLNRGRKVFPFKEGWFKTSDLGAWDHQGNLILRGRRDHIFISGGENINPFEIETTLMSLAGIQAAVVVPVPDAEYGMVAWAFVQGVDLPPDWELAARLKQKLPGYKVPRRFLSLEDPAADGALKLRRPVLQAQAQKLAREPRPDINLHQTGAGQARVLVLLHGFMETGSVFGPLMERLAHRWHCLAPDLPGHGASLFGASRRLRQLNDMSEAATLLLEVLDGAGIQDFVLLGYSMGGRLAQRICLQAPQRVRGLILESASFGIAQAAARAQRRQADRTLLQGLTTQAAFDAFLERWHAAPLFCTLHGTPILKQLMARKRTGNPAELQRALNLYSVGCQPLQAAALHQTGRPMFYLCGALDQKYRAMVCGLKECLPEMAITVFPDASHNIHAQHPEAYAQTIEKILAEL